MTLAEVCCLVAGADEDAMQIADSLKAGIEPAMPNKCPHDYIDREILDTLDGGYDCNAQTCSRCYFRIVSSEFSDMVLGVEEELNTEMSNDDFIKEFL